MGDDARTLRREVQALRRQVDDVRVDGLDVSQIRALARRFERHTGKDPRSLTADKIEATL